MNPTLDDYYAALTQTRIAAQEVAIRALETANSELRLGDDNASIRGLHQSEHQLALAARNLVRAVDALPRERQPKGWAA